MLKWHKVEASAGPSIPTAHSAEGTQEQSKGQGDQGQFSCAVTQCGSRANASPGVDHSAKNCWNVESEVTQFQ